MAGMTDERHIVAGSLALCRALRSVGRDPVATEQAIAEAEAHFEAVRTVSPKPKTENPVKTKGQDQ